MAGDGSVQTNLRVGFVAPAVAAAGGPGIPLLSLATTPGAGGSLHGGQTLYYAVAGVDGSGNESLLSFIVRAVTLSDGSSVRIDGLSFSPGTAGFHVYRGSTPAQLFRIASNQAIATQFTDTGLNKELIAPPDPNFDHANFYWRMELQPESAATIHSASSVGNDGLQMTENRYRGMIVAHHAGTGRGTGAGNRGEYRDEADGLAGMGGDSGCEQFLRGGRDRVAVWGIGKEQPGAVRGAEPRRGDGTCLRTRGQRERPGMLRRAIDGDAVADRRERHDRRGCSPETVLRVGRGAARRHGGAERSVVHRVDEYQHDFGGHVDAVLLGRTCAGARA